MPKNSEGFLVGAVIGLLALILVIAVLFGEQPKAGLDTGTDTEKAAKDSAAVSETDSIATMFGPPAGSDPKTDKPETEGTVADDVATTDDPEADDGTLPEGEAEERVDLDPSVAALGVSMREEFPDGTAYRLVTVGENETFGELVLHWTGDVERLGEVERLNETVDPDNLRPGMELRMPWVDNAVLYRGLEDRRNRFAALRTRGAEAATDRNRAVTDPVRPSAARNPAATAADWNFGGGRTTPRSSTPGNGGSGAGSGLAAGDYEVQKGESLWVIAARRVGKRKAAAYVDRIMAANPKIPSADRVRAGQKIRLP